MGGGGGGAHHEVAVEEDGRGGAQEVGDRLDHVPAELPEGQPREHAPLHDQEPEAGPQVRARPPARRLHGCRRQTEQRNSGEVLGS